LKEGAPVRRAAHHGSRRHGVPDVTGLARRSAWRSFIRTVSDSVLTAGRSCGSVVASGADVAMN